MSDEYEKTLNRSEAKVRYWGIPKEDRDFFPPAHEIFELKFHNKVYELKINHKGDVMTGLLYADYKFFEDNKIKIKKTGKKYVLTADEAQAW